MQLRFIQHNCHKNDVPLQTVLQQGLEKDIDIILLQEPYLPRINGIYICPSHAAYYPVLPQSDSNIVVKPRVLSYIRKRPGLEFVAPTSSQDPDFQVIRIIHPIEPFSIFNIYNGHRDHNIPYTLDRLLRSYPILPQSPTLVVGDFNLHHPWWNPQGNPAKAAEAERLVQWLSRTHTPLLDPEVVVNHGGTYKKPGLHYVSVIDLAFQGYFNHWVWTGWTYLPASGSDHEVITFSASSAAIPQAVPELPAPFNYREADWDLFDQTFKSLAGHAVQRLDGTPDGIALQLSETLRKAAEASIPRSNPSARSKPWWSQQLRALRKAMQAAYRAHRRDPAASLLLDQWKAARNSYFHSTRKAKIQHWEKFLQNATEREVFQAMRYTKPMTSSKIPTINYTVDGEARQATTFDEKCQAFLTSLFPTPLAVAADHPQAPAPQKSTRSASKVSGAWKWPRLTNDEVAAAIATSSPRKAPGPDRIGFAIIQRAYKAHPDIFNKIYKTLFNIGYHPKCWKGAIGIILPKPGKGDYSVPKAYRVIALLCCLGKVLEKIVATRLGYLANGKISILNGSQMGGRTQRSAIDTALLLLHHVQQHQAATKRTSNAVSTTVFLDIKGAFDYVKKPQLLRIIDELGLPRTLRSWVDSFMSDRTIQLAFEGQAQLPTPLNTGVPQGSPVSPILFLLYVHHITGSKGLQLSYMDDFSITASSKSAEKNCAELESVIRQLWELASQQEVIFDPSKTELIHFSTRRQAHTAGIRVGDITILPKEVVRWLGVWFDSKLTFKPHVEKRVALATAAFYRLQRLGSTQKHMSFRALRQLYTACVAPIADYGVQLWWGSKRASGLLKTYCRLQAQVLPLVLGAFRGSPGRALELEASVPPPEVRFERACNAYALRIHQIPWRHPVKAAVSSLARDELGNAESEDEHQPSANSILNYLQPDTQLLQLVCRLKAISTTWDLETPEEPQPPWARTPYVSIYMSRRPKEAAARDHISQLPAILADIGTRVYYTDGSQGTVKGKIQGSAAYCRLASLTTVAAMDSWNLGSRVEVADAEVFAVAKVLEAVTASHGTEALPDLCTTIVIFVDSQAAILRIRSPRGNRWARKIQTAAQALQGRAAVRIHWCPGHCGVHGNEVVDDLAKKALKKPPCSEAYTSFSHIRRLVKAQALDQWRTMWTTEASKPRPQGLGKHYQTISQDSLRFSFKPVFLQLPRKHQTAYIQLKTGIGYLRSYQFTIKKTPFNTCFGNCRSRQTTWHLVLECWTYNAQRALLRKALERVRLPLTLRTLFGTLKGRKALQTYLLDTKICTSQWYYHFGAIRDSLEEELIAPISPYTPHHTPREP